MSKSKNIGEALDELKRLEDLFGDKISELHKAVGRQTERHSFLYYRRLVWDIRELLNKNK